MARITWESLNRPLPIDPRYRLALVEAMAIQTALAVVAALMLDHHRFLHIWKIACCSFWIASLLLIYRRPLNPTKLDLRLTRFGFVPVVVVSSFFAQLKDVWIFEMPYQPGQIVAHAIVVLVISSMVHCSLGCAGYR